MAGLGLILAALVASLLAAACLRQQGLVATLLAAYVAFTANLALATLVLSPFREVTRTWLAVVEGALLGISALAWWSLGRPRPPLAPARAALREIASSRLTLLYLAAIGVLLGYELVLAFTVPANNWDSLTYHLARVAAWYHHGGVYWVANAPTDRINEFQPLAEQQIYFFFVATGTGLLYALPQYLAQLAILAAVYEASRRLGYTPRPSACAACLLATFGLVAYEATTSQNDLVAAALPVVAGCFLLDGSRLESAVAGFAAGTALGVKLTTILVWPVLVGLALLRGRGTFVRAAVGAAVGFVAIGCWSFVLNLAHTGHLLGHGGGRVEHTAGPSFPGSLVTLLSIVYTTLDLSVLWPGPIILLTAVGLAAAFAVAWRSRKTARREKTVTEGAQVALPFLAPVLMILAAAVIAAATRALGTPVRGPGGSYNALGFFGGLNNTADENLSAFGPIGGVLLFGLPLFLAAVWAGRRGKTRIDRRELVLAAAFPSFLVLLALQVAFNPWFPRFLVVPAAITAPLFARLFTGRATTAAYLLVSVAIVALGITRLDTKRLFSSFGAPWHLTESAALAESGQPASARALVAYQARVPPGSSVGAVLSGDFPSYLLGGAGSSGRRVVFLRSAAAADEAARAKVGYVVIADQEAERPAVRSLAAHGWSIGPLGGVWLLAVAPTARKE